MRTGFFKVFLIVAVADNERLNLKKKIHFSSFFSSLNFISRKRNSLAATISAVSLFVGRKCLFLGFFWVFFGVVHRVERVFITKKKLDS